MDSKKFLQLVEEKKKRALEKRQARLEWEERLEEAARSTSRGEKQAHRKHKKKASSDSSIEIKTSRKSSRRLKKKHLSSGSSDDERESRPERKSQVRHRRRSVSSDSRDSDSDSAGHRSRRRHRKHKSSSHESSDISQDDESERKRNRRRHKRRTSDPDNSESCDEDRKHRKRHKQRELNSDDSIESGGKRNHHGHKQRKHAKKHHAGNQRGCTSSQDDEGKIATDGDAVWDSKDRWQMNRCSGGSNDFQTDSVDDCKFQRIYDVHESEPKVENGINQSSLNYDGNGR